MTAIAYYLTIPGLTGDSTDPAYPHAFIVYSHAFTLQQVGNESGKRFSGLTITKPLGRGTAVFLGNNSVSNNTVTLHGVRKGKTDFEFETIVIESPNGIPYFAEEETGSVPTITLTFTGFPSSTVFYTYTPQLPDGTAGKPQTVTISF